MFFLLLSLVAIQRLAELRIAASNVAYLKARGAVEYGAGHYPFMVALHAFWLLSIYLEWWRGGSEVSSQVAWGGALLVVVGQALRWWTIRTLGRRWTTRVLVLPGEPLVEGGPFRYIRHPNYLGVSLEMFGLPLAGGCWRSALLFGGLNLVLLKFRLKVEEEALYGNR